MKNIYHYFLLGFSTIVFLMALFNSITYLFLKVNGYPLGQSFFQDHDFSILNIIYVIIIFILSIISTILNIKYLKSGEYKNHAFSSSVGILILIVIPLFITIFKFIFFTD